MPHDYRLAGGGRRRPRVGPLRRRFFALCFTFALRLGPTPILSSFFLPPPLTPSWLSPRPTPLSPYHGIPRRRAVHTVRVRADVLSLNSPQDSSSASLVYVISF